jgi:UDPglucose 6-dehydrogenase
VALSNEVANICSANGVDVYEVMRGVGLDKRIGPLFLRAGAGFGGSCFPKDLKALVKAAESKKVPLKVLPAVLRQNELQPLETVKMVRSVLKRLKGKTITLLGVAFKPDTDDIRETRALPIAKALFREGAKVRIYDPNKKALEDFMALKEMKKAERAKTLRKALEGADACIIQTEWAEFKKVKPSCIKRWMKRPVVIDGRRTRDPDKMIKAGIIYRGIGWKN